MQTSMRVSLFCSKVKKGIRLLRLGPLVPRALAVHITEAQEVNINNVRNITSIYIARSLALIRESDADSDDRAALVKRGHSHFENQHTLKPENSIYTWFRKCIGCNDSYTGVATVDIDEIGFTLSDGLYLDISCLLRVPDRIQTRHAANNTHAFADNDFANLREVSTSRVEKVVMGTETVEGQDRYFPQI
jgi:hypothetical protein